MSKYQPPDKQRLQADAGWSILQRGSATPEYANALHKFQDGCEALMEYAPERTSGAAAAAGVSAPCRDGSVKLPCPSEAAPHPIVFNLTPGVAEPIGIPCTEGGKHRFNTYDQHCKFCDITRKKYLESRGRKPELIEL